MPSSLKYFLRKILWEFTPPPPAWRGAAIGVIAATLLIFLSSTLDLVSNDVPSSTASLYFLAGSLFIALIGAAIVFIWLALSTLPTLYKWALACFSFIVYYLLVPTQTSSGIALIALWTLLSFSLLGGAICALIQKKNSTPSGLTKTLGCLLIGLLSLILLAYWLLTNSVPFQAPPLLGGEQKTNTINLPDPATPGPYLYANLSYGHGTHLHRSDYGKDATIITPTVDGTAFVKGWQGITGWLRTSYWGFDPSALPLNGLVYHPQGDGPFPLVLIVHGNHEMSAASDRGYLYLAELLASHGFIAVSIDENFLNNGWLDLIGNLDDSPARGWLLLEHLALWRKWNDTSGHIFHNKVDLQRIALIGHSRGGEAIAIAKIFNSLSRFPGDGNILFDYNFNIRALAAIAPVDGQYNPAGSRLKLKNVDYFVMQGSHDGDVRAFEGAAQYQRIRFTEDAPYHFKSALYILGANHGQFNTVWGKKDAPLPSIAFFDLDGILPGDEQRRIAQVYLTAFLKASLQDDNNYLPLFHNYRSAGQWLPATYYVNQFADSTYQYVDIEQDSLDLTKISLHGGSSIGENLDTWRQSQVFLKNGTFIDTGTFLGWDEDPKTATPAYVVALPPNKLSLTPDNMLVLSLAGSDDEDYIAEGADNMKIDFTIVMTDEKQASAELPLSDYIFLYPSVKPKLMKASFLDPLESPDYIFQSFEFPLSHFMANNPAFDPATLQKITLRFDKTKRGLIILDSIAFALHQSP